MLRDFFNTMHKLYMIVTKNKELVSNKNLELIIIYTKSVTQLRFFLVLKTYYFSFTKVIEEYS